MRETLLISLLLIPPLHSSFLFFSPLYLSLAFPKINGILPQESQFTAFVANAEKICTFALRGNNWIKSGWKEAPQVVLPCSFLFPTTQCLALHLLPHNHHPSSKSFSAIVQYPRVHTVEKTSATLF